MASHVLITVHIALLIAFSSDFWILDFLNIEICSLDNLLLADDIARKGKLKQMGVIIHDKNKIDNLNELHKTLINNEYKTSKYTTFKIYEPKERLVYKLPYYPDRILHHAIMNKLESMFVSTFTNNTYSCIKGRGIHKAKSAVEKALKNKDETVFCLKFDIKKFYPSVNHNILKELLRRNIKDFYLLKLLDEIIDSATGVPIGNYMSQYFANFYLSYFDHYIMLHGHPHRLFPTICMLQVPC